MRIAVVISHPIQHYAPVYRILARTPGVDLRVFFCGENGVAHYRDEGFDADIAWNVPLTDGYTHEFLEPGRVLEGFAFNQVDSARLNESLTRFSPDVVWIHGYGQRLAWRAWLWSRDRARTIYTSDSNLKRQRGVLKRLVKSVAVSRFLGAIDCCIAVGSRNQAYLEHYGIARSNMRLASFPVDMARLCSERDALTETTRATLRQSLLIPADARVLLFAGKLLDFKRPQDLIDAMAQISAADAYAVIVGSGPLAEQLKQRARDIGVDDRVRFAGFVNQKEMAGYFDLADLLVFPSQIEPYGAVASEALPFGLPVVASSEVGAIGSSVRPLENALVYPCGDIAALTVCLNSLLSDEKLYQQLSTRSRAMTGDHDASVLANAVIQASRDWQARKNSTHNEKSLA